MKSIQRLCLVAGGAAIAVSCYGWTVWDGVTDRSAPGGPLYPSSPSSTPLHMGGPEGGDGFSSVPLPNLSGRRDRTLWIHGDSVIRNAAAAVCPQTGPNNTPGFPSNIIAVHDISSSLAAGTPPADNERKWYARKTNGTIIDITSDGCPSGNEIGRPFFYNTTYTWTNPPSTGTSNRMWPGDGIVLGGKLFNFVNEWLCTNPADPAQCPMSAVNTHLFSIDNPTVGVLSWHTPVMNTLTASGSSPLVSLSLEWGNAVYSDGTWAYIFGEEFNGTAPNNFYVARAKNISCTPATNPCITNYAQWEFWKGTGAWSQGAPTALSQLKSLGNIAGSREFSIDRVVRNDANGMSKPRYVIVHGRPFVQNDMVVQISKSDSLTDWNTFDPNNAGQYQWIGSIDSDVLGLDPPVEVSGSVPGCLPLAPPFPPFNVWANHGHFALSQSNYLMTTYYATAVDYRKDPQNNDNREYTSCQADPIVGVLRYSNGVDLSKLKPWCISNCWN